MLEFTLYGYELITAPAIFTYRDPTGCFKHQNLFEKKRKSTIKSSQPLPLIYYFHFIYINMLLIMRLFWTQLVASMLLSHFVLLGRS